MTQLLSEAQIHGSFVLIRGSLTRATAWPRCLSRDGVARPGTGDPRPHASAVPTRSQCQGATLAVVAACRNCGACCLRSLPCDGGAQRCCSPRSFAGPARARLPWEPPGAKLAATCCSIGHPNGLRRAPAILSSVVSCGGGTARPFGSCGGGRRGSARQLPPNQLAGCRGSRASPTCPTVRAPSPAALTGWRARGGAAAAADTWARTRSPSTASFTRTAARARDGRAPC
jgi:hypothetical protein